MKKWVLIVCVVLTLALVAAIILVPLQLSGAFSDVSATVQVGDPMPDFSLADYNGKTHTLKQYAGKIVVLVFCSHKCPFSRGIDQNLAAMARSHDNNENIVFLGIDSHYDTTAEEIRAHAVAMGLPYPILRDPGNAYADAVGALVTPDIFIVSKKGELAYRGAFDNRLIPDRPGSIGYAANAIDALLIEILVNPTHVPAWGCTIKRAS